MKAIQIRARGCATSCLIGIACLVMGGSSALASHDSYIDYDVFVPDDGAGWAQGGGMVMRQEAVPPDGWPFASFPYDGSRPEGVYPGENFYGRSGSGTLNISCLDCIFATTDQIYVSFDLVLIGDWGGDGDTITLPPDFGEAAIDATFSHSFLSSQSYPDVAGSGAHPAGTGATLFEPEKEYIDPVVGIAGSIDAFSVYPISFLGGEFFEFVFDVGFVISADLSSPDLVWGIDNIRFTEYPVPVPEPGTAILLGAGLLILARRSSPDGC